MIKKILTVMLISLTVVNSSFANQAIDVKAGQAAPYDGVLLDKEKANEIKNELIDKDGLTQINLSLNKTIELHQKNTDTLNQSNAILMDRNLDLTKELNSSRELSTFTKVLYFVGGVALTGAAVWGASKLSR